MAKRSIFQKKVNPDDLAKFDGFIKEQFGSKEGFDAFVKLHNKRLGDGVWARLLTDPDYYAQAKLLLKGKEVDNGSQ